MIWITLILFMIGQKLDMSTAYWVIWGIYIFFSTISATVDAIKKVKELK